MQLHLEHSNRGIKSDVYFPKHNSCTGNNLFTYDATKCNGNNWRLDVGMSSDTTKLRKVNFRQILAT